MPASIPASPSINQVITVNGEKYIWSGQAWVKARPTTGSVLSVTTGPLSARPLVGSIGDMWVVRGETALPAANGISYVWDESASQWRDISTDDFLTFDNRYANVTYEDMDGDLFLPYPAAADMHAVTKLEVDRYFATFEPIIRGADSIVRESNGEYTYTITSTKEITVIGNMMIDLVIVGGGGGGGDWAGGGGGAGGVIQSLNRQVLSGVYGISIGGGGNGAGAGSGGNGGLGGSSNAFGLVANGGGGGGGGYNPDNGQNGGSGGGGGRGLQSSGGAGTSGQGNNGAGGGNTIGGGGGGAGSAGASGNADRGRGGQGINVFGRLVAAGGGGGYDVNVHQSAGGTYVSNGGSGSAGGNGGWTFKGIDAPANTGHGGGGGGRLTATGGTGGGSGGSGIVIIRQKVIP